MIAVETLEFSPNRLDRHEHYCPLATWIEVHDKLTNAIRDVFIPQTCRVAMMGVFEAFYRSRVGRAWDEDQDLSMFHREIEDPEDPVFACRVSYEAYPPRVELWAEHDLKSAFLDLLCKFHDDGDQRVKEAIQNDW